MKTTKSLLGGVLLVATGLSLAACSYHRTVVENPPAATAAPATVVVPAQPAPSATVVVPPGN